MTDNGLEYKRTVFVTLFVKRLFLPNAFPVLCAALVGVARKYKLRSSNCCQTGRRVQERVHFPRICKQGLVGYFAFIRLNKGAVHKN
jgi:hypothetical protein